ncbi:hypothetical protein FEP87_05596 [Burkholderia multivorans]|nr:hypothetical protein [Burkholderia multivorans]MDR8859290.1 hypothetical protein [Burkholderia multivorans]
MILHVDLRAALLFAQRDHGADVVLRHVQVHGDDRLADLGDARGLRHLRRVLDHDRRAVALHDLVDDRRCGRDEVHVEFALEPLLHDFHVQQPEEAAAETEAERLRHFRLVLQRCVVELQLLERFAQRVVLVRLDRIEAREHLRLHFLEARQRLGRGLRRMRDRIADLRGRQFLDAGDDEAHLPRRQRFQIARLRREHADVLDRVLRAGRHQLDLVLRTQRAVHDAHEHHDADVVVEPGVDDQRLQRRGRIALRRRHLRDQRLEHVLDAEARLRAAARGVGRVDADHVLDLGDRVLGVRGRQVDLVQHRHDLDAELDRRVAVRDRLRFDALACIDDEQRALARGQRTADLVREIDVPRRIDQVQVVDLAVARAIRQCSRLRLDRDAALALDVHRVEHLRFHFTVGETAADLDDAIRERRLAMVDVRDDREIANMIHSVPIKRKRRARRPRSTPCKSVKKRPILAEKAFAGR